MFKKIASEALGLSDIGKIIPPSDYDKVEADDYILHEENEKIFFLIKSKQDEYCFTNRALVHIDGNSALNKKRLLKRYEYYQYPIYGVLLETAGNIDLDVEIKFTLGYKSSASSSLKTSSNEGGDVNFSIDVDKKQLAQLKDLYKALYEMSLLMSEGYSHYNDCLTSLDKSMQLLADSRGESPKAEELSTVNNYIYEWLRQAKDKYIKKDFADIFLKYINN